MDGIIDISGHEFVQTLGDSEGQESLVCCSPWGRQELDMTEQLNNNRCVYCGYIYFDIYGCVHTYESCLHASALFAIAENPRIK